jgi:ATP-dependent DNA helicase RecG
VDLFRRVEQARRKRILCRGPKIKITPELEKRIGRRIPFEWTGEQAAAVEQIKDLLIGSSPMGLMLQGDVGTGKTAVAVYAALAALANRHQVAFLAPTELLAEQHHDVFRTWLKGSRVKTGLVTAGLRESDRCSLERSLRAGIPRLVFGTQAMLSERTVFSRLGLVIIDEQHRFGVNQRMKLVAKGVDPHVLVMTATPIPRTLTLTLFGDLDLVTLRERPPGRRPVRAVFLDPHRWRRCLDLITRRVHRGEQVYVVCAKIGEDGEKGGAVRMHEELARRFSCRLVHGRMTSGDRQTVLAEFRKGVFPVLVGTTVLEVGVDVPDATLMVVAGADRFGLSTLHQLRGRVGRGGRRGLCVLAGKRNDRSDAICRTTDGFALAEEDLKLRGSGELLGTRQSGYGELRALDPVQDLELLLRVRTAVREEK